MPMSGAKHEDIFTLHTLGALAGSILVAHWVTYSREYIVIIILTH